MCANVTMPYGMGCGIPHQLESASLGYIERTLGILWPPNFYTWKYNHLDIIYPFYLPMVFDMRVNDAANRAMQLSHYGPRLWLLGNEPERKDQSNIPPEEAAQFSHVWADTAGGEWAAPGVLLGSPDAYTWYDTYLQTGGLVGICHHVHIYALTPEHFDNQLRDFEQWMRDKRIERPILVTECASWSPHLSDQIKVMDRVWETVQRESIISAMWYSSHTYPGGPLGFANLLTDDGTAVTQLGAHYMSLKGTPLPPPEPPPDMDKKIHLPIVMG